MILSGFVTLTCDIDSLRGATLSPGTESNRFAKWVVVGLLWLVAVLNYADRMAISSVFPLLKKEMGVSDTALALVGSSFLWVYSLSSPLGGYFGDRFNRKQVIILSLGLFSVVTCVTGFAQNGVQLIACCVLLGVSEAIFLPSALAHIASFHTDATRSLANAICLAGFPVGSGVGVFLGGYMGDHYSWRAGFYFLGIAGIMVALALVLFLPNRPPLAVESGRRADGDSCHEPPLPKMASILSTPTALCVIALGFALSVGSWPTNTWAPMYLFERFGMSLTRSGFTMAFFTYTPALLGSAVGGIWADRWAKRDCRGRIGVDIVALVFMAPALLALGFMRSGLRVAVCLFVYSLARGMAEVNQMPIFSTVVPPHRWSTAYGLHNLIAGVAGSLGILLVGTLKGWWGIGYGLSALSLFLFVGMVVMHVAWRHLAADMRKLADAG